MMPRILIIDEHSAFRVALNSLLELSIPQAELLQAGSLVEVLPDGRINRPFDIVLLDPGSSGFYAMDAVRKTCDAIPASRFAIISASDSRKNILLA